MSDFWPHKFTKLGAEEQIGERKLMESEMSKTMTPIMAQRMVCVCCHIEFMKGKDPQPGGQCPARTTKDEEKRILNVSR